jgi:putative ABC transport system substrate-binding protein
LDRRTFVCTLTGSLLAAPLAAAAQQAGKVYRIGVLMNKASDPAESRQWQGLWLGLRERGWIQGENILVELREAEGNSSRVPDLAADLVRRKMDLIVTRGSLFTGAVKAATSSIPIVFIAHADPVGSGHVASLARPGGNITGLAILQTELGAKGLEILRSVGPTVTRIAVLWHPGTPSAAPGLKALEEPARRLRLELLPVGARGPAELERAFAAMARARAQGVIVLATPIFFGERQRLGELAIAHRLPTMFQIRDYAEAGGLMSYGADLADLYRRAAIPVDKILKGAKPGDIPIEQPTKFELVINLRTAKALGLTIPPSLLQRADQVIE